MSLRTFKAVIGRHSFLFTLLPVWPLFFAVLVTDLLLFGRLTERLFFFAGFAAGVAVGSLTFLFPGVGGRGRRGYRAGHGRVGRRGAFAVKVGRIFWGLVLLFYRNLFYLHRFLELLFYVVWACNRERGSTR